MNRQQASASVIAGALLWGIISIFTKHLAAYGLSPLQITFCRSGFSAILMFFFLLIRDRKLLRIHLRNCWMFAGTGVVSLTLFNWCYFTTIEGSQTSIAVALLYSSPIFVALLSAAVFHEKLTLRTLAALVLTVCGCILVSCFLTDASGLRPVFLLTGFGSGLFYALYTIFGRFALARYDTLTVVFYTFVFGGIGSAPFCNVPDIVHIFVGAPQSILWLFGICILCTILPYLLYSAGLRYIESGKAAILATAELFMGSLVGIGLYREPCTGAKLLGLAFIISAVILLNLPQKPAVRKADGHETT